jgi:hypothetical protein
MQCYMGVNLQMVQHVNVTNTHHGEKLNHTK